jgi:hypothetical protein
VTRACVRAQTSAACIRTTSFTVIDVSAMFVATTILRTPSGVLMRHFSAAQREDCPGTCFYLAKTCCWLLVVRLECSGTSQMESNICAGRTAGDHTRACAPRRYTYSLGAAAVLEPVAHVCDVRETGQEYEDLPASE